uniref:Integrin alpha-M-like n=1 Tax=Callorhinchus milii TaxID=7868 RepID=A0A4W3GTJ8_CALMI
MIIPYIKCKDYYYKTRLFQIVLFFFLSISLNKKRDTKHSSARQSLPVQFQINVILKGLESTQYINGTSNAEVQMPIEHVYKVENLGQVSLPVTLTFKVPIAMKPNIFWESINISSNDLTNIKCRRSNQTSNEKSSPVSNRISHSDTGIHRQGHERC